MVRIIAVKVSNEEHKELEDFKKEWNKKNSPASIMVSTMMRKLALSYIRGENKEEVE